jgi:hypothetical protein
MSELPLIASWERQAAKSLAQCLYLLSHGQFMDVDDFAAWLKAEAEALALLVEPDREEEPMRIEIPANRYDYKSGWRVEGEPYDCDECNGAGSSPAVHDLICPVCNGCGQLKTLVEPVA